MAAIFMMASIPDTGDPGYLVAFVSPTIQNLLHIPAYGLLALLWILTLVRHGIAKYRSMWMAILLSSAYGAVIEFFQILIPGRFASFTDFLLNVTGILLFAWIYKISYQRSAVRHQLQ